MKVPALTKEIFEQCTSLGVTKIHVSLSGGSDEAYVNICLYKGEEVADEHELEEAVEGWVWSNFGYSGAGDGSEYGDEIIYCLASKTVETSAWGMVQTEMESEYSSGDMEVE